MHVYLHNLIYITKLIEFMLFMYKCTCNPCTCKCNACTCTCTCTVHVHVKCTRLSVSYKLL